MNWVPPPRAEYTNAERREQIKASIYFKRKMDAGSQDNARYNHFMASLAVAAHDNNAAKLHYQQTVASSPGDVLARSDYALHLQRMGREYENDAREALRKALLIAPDHAVLHKNAGSLLAQSGQFRQGQQHTQRSLQLNDSDAMSHRNFARITSRLGDTHTALKHNLTAIALEQKHNGGAAAAAIAPAAGKGAGASGVGTTHTNAYRQAAVQIIATGGDKALAHRLMDAARAAEGQRCQLPTSQGTAEVTLKMLSRRGDAEAELEREKAKEVEKMQLLQSLANEDVGTMLGKLLGGGHKDKPKAKAK